MGDPRTSSIMAFFWHGRALAWMLLWGANIFLLLGYFGWLVPSLDVLAHMRTHFVGAGLVGGIALMLPRFTQIVAVAGCALVLTSHALVAWSQQDHAGRAISAVNALWDGRTTKVSRPGSQIISLLTYNTWHENTDLTSLAHLVLREDADVVVLLEFGPNKRKLLEMWKGRYPYQAHCSDKWQCSVVILSKRPWTLQRIVQRAETRSPLVMVRFGHGANSTTFAATHLYRPIDGTQRQLNEVHTLTEELNQLPGSLVLAGDFNATRWSHAYKSLVGGLGLVNATVFAPTWPRWFPQLSIDHIFVRGGVEPFNTKIAQSGASDHLALRTELLLKTTVPGGVTQRAKSKAGRQLDHGKQLN